MIKNLLTSAVIECIERGWMNDALTRRGIRYLCGKRLQQVKKLGPARQQLQEFVQRASAGPIAPLADKANEQHYEIPAEFFELVLGRRKKYSCCLYGQAEGLNEAEVDALEATCQRAELVNGMSILELGCGWGSLTLWMAENYPNSQITAVSNSGSQRAFILEQAKMRGVDKNLTVITADMNDFDSADQFDRVVSVEMFEHMRNHQSLLEKVSQWLKPDGKLFVHIFCNKEFTYPFETEGASNWMGRYFFTGGIMPGEDLFAQYNRDLKVQRQWVWNGTHYERTSNDWLKNLDQNYNQVLGVLEEVYGKRDAKRWLNRWRVFFLACAELFGMQNGEQWYVAHYLFEQASSPADVQEEPVCSQQV
jgi:cyclopropane-fatty-acyl-phospholipid synthase